MRRDEMTDRELFGAILTNAECIVDLATTAASFGKKCVAKDNDPNVAEELDVALDALAVAHIAKTIRMGQRPLTSDNLEALQ